MIAGFRASGNGRASMTVPDADIDLEEIVVS